MPARTDPLIADALRRHLAALLLARPDARTFFRVSGFAEGAYAALLDDLAARGWRLGDTVLEVRSIGQIVGHADRVLEPGRSATWYRNNLADRHALVLIQNRLSTDAQSLKDLFPVTELALSRDGLPHLIDACCTRYQLAPDERAALVDFVRLVARVLYEPQLRALGEFLAAVDQQLAERPGTAVGHAVVMALPHLGLFRCLDLEPDLATPRADKLIRQLHKAARIGDEVLEERTRGDYLRRLETAPLDDDGAIGGLGKERKRALLRRFIEGDLRDDREGRFAVLQIDWRDIQLVITAKSRTTRAERLSKVAAQLKATPGLDAEDEAVADLLADLEVGSEPDDETVGRVLASHADALPRQLRGELRRLVKTRTRKHGDFLVGLTALAVELLHVLQDDLPPGARLAVTPDLAAASDQKQLPEALLTFRAMFGGLERALPSVDWRLGPLWEQAASPPDEPAEGEEAIERERLARVELPFRVSVEGPDGAELEKAELLWQYRSDSPAAATALTLAAERALLGDEARLRVPVFNNLARREEIGDLDIRRPIHSLGAWFDAPRDLRAILTAQLQRRARPEAEAALSGALDRLELAWGAFVATAAASGLLAADSEGLLAAYDELLATAIASLRTDQEVRGGFRALNQAWVIGPASFDRWAVLPLLHPLKLLWWRERARHFDGVIARLLDPARPARIVDVERFRRELAATYGSSGFPAALALPPGEGMLPERFLPVEEADGYELYFRHDEGGEPFGMATGDLADDEAAIAAQRAVEGIAAVVQDYIETYPFVRDGLELVLYECRNGALPGLLAERLAELSGRRGWPLRLAVTVHTSDRGAPLFQRVSAWVKAEHALADRRGGDFFPPVGLRVRECSPDELLRSREDTDLVILADVLAGKGQRVVSDLDDDAPPDQPAEGWLPTAQAQQEPYEEGDLSRRLLLGQRRQPSVVRRFLLAQHAAIERLRRQLRPDAAAQFHRELTLEAWEQVLGRLHDHFNWVVCYDPAIDRFLLESAFPEKVQVIRYALGLGAKRQHNLTVSSSHKAQAVVEQRLAARLAQMLPMAKAWFLTAVASQLVARAKAISGDIVLRAAGPGAFLNELIGLVAARFATERRFLAVSPRAMTAWILLDDFEHWFGGGKFPDMLFVAIEGEPAGGLRLHLEVIEAKCVGQISFEREAADAQTQVRIGVGRLGAAFAAGAEHMDALYWYDQLYRAVVGNLKVDVAQQGLWELFRDRLQTGNFRVTVEGHSWAFCYDGPAGLGDGPNEYDLAPAGDLEGPVPLRAHHYGRGELCALLRELIEAGGVPPAPAEMWTPAVDTLPPVDLLPADEPPHAEETAGGVDEARAEAAAESEASEQSGGGAPPEAPPSGVGAQIGAVEPAGGGAPQPPPAPFAFDESEQQWLKDKARALERALRDRAVQVLPIDPAVADVGPSIVRFKLRLRPNETLRKIQGVAEDLARDLALGSTPIVANVPRTSFVGVDIPRDRPRIVELRPLLDALGTPGQAELPIILGVTPDGTLLTEDLSEFPHLLVAGATNSGKSVFLRSLLLSLMTQYRPGQLELLIVDPKRTDFTFFSKLPYLRGGKVLIDAREAREALLELVRREMPRRQDIIADRSTKVKLFNALYPDEALPPIVALIDEYALLVSMMDRKEREAFEQDLMLLAAAARSVSIHLVLATQRPSADIVTSTLKANLDARIACKVASSTNSRVVLDETGAENLLGRGDLLFRRPSGEIVRLQAPFMSEEAMRAYLAGLRR